MMVLKPGTVFAQHYEVVRVLSAGGMGVVYEVLHRDTKRRRALKIMLPHVVTDPDMRKRFALEAVVTADIESEHLVEVFDAGIDGDSDCPYLVMELLRGEDLGAKLRRNERLSPPELVALLDQAARALEKTHAAGIVHRDLKPENLFLTRRDDGSPRLKILDFGIAKVLRSTSGDPKSTTKTFGTPYYMAREQITGEAQLIGPASDTYALAHIAYALLVGVPYFDDEASASAGNMLSLLLAVGKGPQEPAAKRAAKRGVDLPPEFDAWFDRATRADPRKRYGSARDLVAALGQVLSGLPDTPLGGGAIAAMTALPPPSDFPPALGGTIPIDSPSSSPPPLQQAQRASVGGVFAKPQLSPLPSSADTPPGPSQTGSPFSTTSAKKIERRPRYGLLIGVVVAAAAAIALALAVGPLGRDPQSAGAVSSPEPPITAGTATQGAGAAPIEPVVTAMTTTAAPSASVEPTASLTASTSAQPPRPVRIPTRPTAGPTTTTAEPVWKTR